MTMLVVWVVGAVLGALTSQWIFSRPVERFFTVTSQARRACLCPMTRPCCSDSGR